MSRDEPRNNTSAERAEAAADGIAAAAAEPASSLAEILHSRWLTWVAAVALPIIATIIGLGLWFDAQIKTVVAMRIEPYEHLLNGITLNQNEDYYLAVPEFSNALDGLAAQGASEERLVAVVNHYMDAISNSDDPEDHEPDFNRLIDNYLGKKAPKTAWLHERIGWYHFQTNRLDQAIKRFEDAKAKYRATEQYRAAAWVNWAHALAMLAKGDATAAVTHTNTAATADPRNFSLQILVKDWPAVKNEKWFNRLKRLYPEFEESGNEFFAILKSMSPP